MWMPVTLEFIGACVSVTTLDDAGFFLRWLRWINTILMQAASVLLVCLVNFRVDLLFQGGSWQ
ncbi:hypothetical protein RchiOBHm_Chr1g0353491 [Rosa chinensis]|uniref:Uncharacterized protein n=1 Tax=Rosa chinensis TaxID=74649 RepID=A0A2P6SGW3_ROSCH|nr:hypothetical protein RchiOBHm_Chr1g0353491 [Rosa chinensis]